MNSEVLVANSSIGQSYDALTILCMAGCFVSPVCIFVHLFKFFNSPDKQNLPSKNLASYCMCSLLMYICMISYSCFTGIFGHDKLLTLREYLYIASSLLLLNMSLDTYLCMRKSVKNFRVSKGSRDNVFVIYSIFAWGVALLATTLLYLNVESVKTRFNVVLAITMLMRMSCFGLFCLSAYYIVSANITNKNLRSYAFMHARLLLINGITSVLWYATLAMIYFFDAWNGLLEISLFLSVLLYAFDGVFIALFYTFKKGMFEGKNAAELKKRVCTKISVISSEFVSSPQSNVHFTFDRELESGKIDS